MFLSRIWEYLLMTGIHLWAPFAVLRALEPVIERLFPSFWNKRAIPWFTPQRRKQALLWVALIAFFVGTFLAWNEEHEAKLTIESKVKRLEQQNITVFVENSPSFITTIVDGSVYVRFLVHVDGDNTAICRAYLNELYREGDQAPFVTRQNLLLSAENGGEVTSYGFNFYRGSEHYFNIGYLTLDKNLMITSDEFQGIVKGTMPVGKYHARVSINGPNCGPHYSNIAFEYDGQNVRYLIECG